MRTRFTRIHLDPAALLVNIDDLGFASSTGELVHAGDLSGGGNCGWTAPSCTFGPEALQNGWSLDLAYVGP